MSIFNRRLRVAPVVGLAALPDTQSIARVLALQSFTAGQLRGGDGVIGVDRGDPTVSLTGPVAAVSSPTDAVAAVYAGEGNAAMPTPTFADAALQNPAMDGYQRTLLARMQRS